MSAYANQHQVIIGLHERGFTEDFKMANCGIWWVQQQVLLRMNDFAIVESCPTQSCQHPGQDIIILGIFSLFQSLKGILIHDLQPAIIPLIAKYSKMKNVTY